MSMERYAATGCLFDAWLSSGVSALSGQGCMEKRNISLLGKQVDCIQLQRMLFYLHRE